MKKDVHATTAALLAELVPLGAGFSESTNAVYGLTEPLQEVLAAVQARVSKVSLLRRRADASEEDEQVFAQFEQIKQTCAAALRISSEIQDRFDQLTDVMCQLDRCGRQAQDVVESNGATPRILRSGAVLLEGRETK